nr:uncharacterized protein LOC109175532 [Ipomoea batatas]
MASLAEEIPVGFHGKLDAVSDQPPRTDDYNHASDPAGKLQNADEEEEHPRMNKKLPDLKDSKISEGVNTKTSFLNYNDMLKKILAIDDIHHGAFDITSGNGISDEASKNGITALLPAIHLKMEESERRFGNGDQTWKNNLQIGSSGKSPSFDFGVPFDAAKGSGFDQTPLLHPFRKTPVRSLSINDFQDRIIQTRYGRNSVDYDAKSEAPFLNNKENINGSDDEKTQESFGSDDMDYWAEKKLKGNGKTKARHSFFSACICCIASTE